MEIPNEVRDEIEHLLEEKKLSYREIAERCGVSKTTVSNIDRKLRWKIK